MEGVGQETARVGVLMTGEDEGGAVLREKGSEAQADVARPVRGVAETGSASATTKSDDRETHHSLSLPSVHAFLSQYSRNGATCTITTRKLAPVHSFLPSSHSNHSSCSRCSSSSRLESNTKIRHLACGE